MVVKDKTQKQEIAKTSSSGAFQKKLIQFFRTGELEKEENPDGLRSAFQYFFKNQPTKYPFKLGEKEFYHNDELIDQLIVHHLQEYQQVVLTDFKKQLNQLIDALAQKLSLKHEKESDDQTFDFASQMIAFDKLAKVVPSQASNDLNDRRKTRLTKVLKRLKRGLASYSKLDAVLVRSMSSNATVGSSDQMKVITASRKQAFAEVQDMLTHNIKAFTRLMKAFHIAQLEVLDAYREDIHRDYFEYFSWYWLSEAEKGLMQPVFLMLDSSYLRYHLEDLSHLISSNWPVRVILLHPTLVNLPMEGVKWEDASHRVRQEMATFAISHRNVVLQQLTSADPARLSDSIRDWIACTRPTLIHLLMPDNHSDRDYKTTYAAVYSRYFPCLSFDPRQEASNNQQWSLSGNPQMEICWPIVEGLPTGMDQEMPFTYADYKALSSAKVSELLLVPDTVQEASLTPLHLYLELPKPERIGKVPFIWLADSYDKLHRAAVPYVWVVSCEERMEFWAFLKGISGHIENGTGTEGLAKEDAPLVAASAAPNPEALAELEKRAMAAAAERLIKGLLD